MSSVWDAMRDLHHALSKLKPEQGPRARRNARRAVSFAIRSLKHAVGRDWSIPEVPLLTPTERAQRKRLTPQEKARRRVERTRKLRLRGYIVGSANCIETMALAGVRIIRIKTSADTSQIWAPFWAYTMWQEGMKPGQITRMKKDRQARKAWLAEHALRNADIT